MQAGSGSSLPVSSLHTVLFCLKWQECISFYQDALGFSAVFENKVFVEFEVTPGARIGLLDASRSRRGRAHPEGVILSFRVSDLDRAYEILRSRNCQVSLPRNHPWGARPFEIEDPEGRRIEFWADPP